MTARYRSLPPAAISGEAGLAKPMKNQFMRISLDDNALSVMTDLQKASAITVQGITPIGQALEPMIQSGVRSLFVLDNESRVIGLITSYDIQGEKPIRYLQSLDCTHRTCCRNDVLVKDIMEPMDKLKNVDFKRVRDATVGHIVATFRRVGRKHLVVVDHNRDQDEPTIRGIFSATQLERQLGMTLVATSTTHSFADVEQALMHGW